ncbi:MAG: tRNA 2-selenouridine(34) synthase MnmH [Pseudomonadota bacterium]
MTRLALANLADQAWQDYDTVIDVRSPAEFAEDHLPGAISLPVLSNEERARVGTIYTRESPFLARKIGAALVSRNAADHIETSLMERDGAWRPLVYCWRGGQRSGSFASILAAIGWRVATLEGGYQSYRKLVSDALYGDALPHRVIRLDGYTGTAKTALLHRVAELGGQVIDLEGLARHRGSALGPVAEGQPAQKGFETALAMAILKLDPARPVLIEAESARIGDLRLPPALWKAMRSAPRLLVSAPETARARYLAEVYADIVENVDDLCARLDLLRPIQGHEVVEGWQAMARSRQWVPLAADLAQRHYDPAYARLRRRDPSPVLARFEAEGLAEADLHTLATRLTDWLKAAENT